MGSPGNKDLHSHHMLATTWGPRYSLVPLPTHPGRVQGLQLCTLPTDHTHTCIQCIDKVQRNASGFDNICVSEAAQM